MHATSNPFHWKRLIGTQSTSDPELATKTTRHIQHDLAAAQATLDAWHADHQRPAPLTAADIAAALDHAALLADSERDEAADIVWATASSELFVLLTDERGWTLDHYQDWLADTWRRLLLRPDTVHWHDSTPNARR